MSKFGISHNSYANNYLAFQGFKNTTKITKPCIKIEKETEKQESIIEKQELITEKQEIIEPISIPESNLESNVVKEDANDNTLCCDEPFLSYNSIYKTEECFETDLKDENEMNLIIKPKVSKKMADVVMDVIKNIKEKKKQVNGWTH